MNTNDHLIININEDFDTTPLINPQTISTNTYDCIIDIENKDNYDRKNWNNKTL